MMLMVRRHVRDVLHAVRIGRYAVAGALGLGLSLAGAAAPQAALPWVLKFSDTTVTPGAPVTKYFKDGTTARMSYTARGLDVVSPAGTGQTVVWTKTAFDGDIKVEFDYTRLDTPVAGRNIASIVVLDGWGLTTRCRVDSLVHPVDIKTWSRPVANYDYYKFCMTDQTVSYDNLDLGTNPRMTIRQNPGYFDRGTIVPPALRTGVTYHLIVTRTGNTVLAIAKQGAVTVASVTGVLDPARSKVSKHGYVGFRQMASRHAAYRNIKISTR